MRSTTTITAVRPLRSRFLLARTSDERLREQLRGGNEVAFEVLFDRHHGALLSFCRHLLGSLEEAEDAVQLTLLSAYRQLCTPGRRINHLKPWLFTVAHNRCVSILRTRREAPSAELPERVSVAGLSEQVEAREDIRHLLVDLAEATGRSAGGTAPRRDPRALARGDLSRAQL